MERKGKVLIFVAHVPGNDKLATMREYLDFHKDSAAKMSVSVNNYEGFGGVAILNDYGTFMEKVCHRILSL